MAAMLQDRIRAAMFAHLNQLLAGSLDGSLRSADINTFVIDGRSIPLTVQTGIWGMRPGLAAIGCAVRREHILVLRALVAKQDHRYRCGQGVAESNACRFEKRIGETRGRGHCQVRPRLAAVGSYVWEVSHIHIVTLIKTNSKPSIAGLEPEDRLKSQGWRKLQKLLPRSTGVGCFQKILEHASVY